MRCRVQKTSLPALMVALAVSGGAALVCMKAQAADDRATQQEASDSSQAVSDTKNAALAGGPELGGAPVAVKAEELSDGSRIELADKGFSIVPPAGWEIHRDYPNLSLLLQVPFKPGANYQRTIQVMQFQGPAFIDRFTADEFNDLIVRKFSNASGGAENYRIRNHMGVDLPNGENAWLFYSEFSMRGTPFMQMHLLVSSATHHYLLTYTDVASHFESEGSVDSEYLTTAWQAMMSIELDSPAPQRFQMPLLMGIGVASLALLAGLFGLIRYWLAARRYRKLAGEDADQALDDADDGEGDEPQFELDVEQPIASSKYATLAEEDDDSEDDDAKSSQRWTI